jgi:hypothetical protein
LSRIFLEASPQQADETWRDIRRQPRPRRLHLDDAGDRIGDVVALERAPASEHLEQHAPERPDVRPFVHDPATCLARA